MGERTRRTIPNPKISKLIDFITESYIGVIEDIDDPNFEGRCKIRVYGIYGDTDESLGSIPTEHMPWAYPLHDFQFGSIDGGTGKFSTPKMGAKVRVKFEGDQYHPRYFSLEHIDGELKSIIEADYENFNSIMYDSDEQMKMYYAVNTGFLLELKETFINIEPNGAVVIQHKGGSAIIEIRGDDIDVVTNNSMNVSTPNNITLNTNQAHINGAFTDLGANPIYSNVNGEILMKLLLAIATGLDAKYPSTPGQFANLVTQMEALILSNTVKTSG